MGIHNRKWNMLGRRVITLLLLCGDVSSFLIPEAGCTAQRNPAEWA